jgi:hypothetical protein
MLTSNIISGEIYLLLNRAFKLLSKKHNVPVEDKKISLSSLLAKGCNHKIDVIKDFSESVKLDYKEIVEKIESLDQSLLDQFMSYLIFYQENINQLENASSDEVDDYLVNLTFYLSRDIQDFISEHEKVKKKQRVELFHIEAAKLLTASFNLYPN